MVEYHYVIFRNRKINSKEEESPANGLISLKYFKFVLPVMKVENQ